MKLYGLLNLSGFQSDTQTLKFLKTAFHFTIKRQLIEVLVGKIQPVFLLKLQFGDRLNVKTNGTSAFSAYQDSEVNKGNLCFKS